MIELAPITNITPGTAINANVGTPPAAAVIVIYNQTPYNLTIQLGGGGGVVVLPAWTADKYNTGAISGFGGMITITPASVITGLNISNGAITIIAYGTNEPVNAGYPLALSASTSVANQQRVISVPVAAGATPNYTLWNPAVTNPLILQTIPFNQFPGKAIGEAYVYYLQIEPYLAANTWNGMGAVEVALQTYATTSGGVKVNASLLEYFDQYVTFNPATMAGKTISFTQPFRIGFDLADGGVNANIALFAYNTSFIPLLVTSAISQDTTNSSGIPAIGTIAAGVY